MNQAIQNYIHTHLYLQIYHHKLSNLLVAMSDTGCADDDVHSFNWRAYSHSNVGFNTYLQYVAKCMSYSVTQAIKQDEDRVAMHIPLTTGQKNTAPNCSIGLCPVGIVAGLVGFGDVPWHWHH